MTATRRELVDRLPPPLRPGVRGAWRALLAGWFGVADRLARPHPRPVFLLGNQKAGTSAIAGLLGMLTGLSTTVDLRRENHRQTYLRLVRGELDFDRFVRRNGLDFSRAIIKEPNLTLFHDALRARWPEARFAFIVRDPRDNLRSILDWLRIPGDLERLEPRHMEHVDPGFELVLDGRWCGIGGGDHYVDRLAERWNVLADVWLEHRESMPLIRYEDFLRDKRGELERLARALGCTPRHDIGPALDRAFRPRGRVRAGAAQFFGPRNLARIDSRCAERMRAFGYAPTDSGAA